MKEPPKNPEATPSEPIEPSIMWRNKWFKLGVIAVVILLIVLGTAYLWYSFKGPKEAGTYVDSKTGAWVSLESSGNWETSSYYALGLEWEVRDNGKTILLQKEKVGGEVTEYIEYKVEDGALVDTKGNRYIKQE